VISESYYNDSLVKSNNTEKCTRLITREVPT